MKVSFRALRKKDGSIGDFAVCNWNIIFLTEEYKVDVIWSLEDHNTGKNFKHSIVDSGYFIVDSISVTFLHVTDSYPLHKGKLV